MPSSPNYKRDYTREREIESDKRKQNRSDRNKARRMAEAFYGKEAIRGKDVDHKRELGQGGSNNLSNLRPMDPQKNRSYPRTKTGAMRRGR